MKVTVDLSDSEIREICFLTGETKKGPAIRKMVIDALNLKRREQVSRKFITGEWGVDLDNLEAGQARDRESSEGRNQAWRPE